MAGLKKTLLFINQYYYPDLASTGQLLTELTQSLAPNYEITVLTTYPSYASGLWSQRKCLWQRHNIAGVQVIRVYATAFSRGWLPLRIMNYLTFFMSAFIAVHCLRRRDLVIAQTDPPVIGLVAWWYSLIRSVPLLMVMQDVFPEVGIVLNKLSGPVVIILRRIRRWLARRAAAIVVISEGMRQKLANLEPVTRDKMWVISNWADTHALQSPTDINPFRQQHQLQNQWVIMHSGNIGLSQDFELILDTAWYLARYDDICFVIIGSGAKRDWLVQQIRSRSLEARVRLLAYQDKSNLSHSLAAADLHLVTLQHGLENLIEPSKIFGIMAVAKPMLSSVAPGSQAYELIDKYKIGVNVEASAKAMAAAILQLRQQPVHLIEMGQRGRDLVEHEFSRAAMVQKYRQCFEQITTKEKK